MSLNWISVEDRLPEQEKKLADKPRTHRYSHALAYHPQYGSPWPGYYDHQEHRWCEMCPDPFDDSSVPLEPQPTHWLDWDAIPVPDGA